MMIDGKGDIVVPKLYHPDEPPILKVGSAAPPSLRHVITEQDWRAVTDETYHTNSNFGAQICITETKTDRKYTTCTCGLFVWERVKEVVELFDTRPPKSSGITQKQLNYISSLMNIIEDKVLSGKVSAMDYSSLISLWSNVDKMHIREASAFIDRLRGYV